MEQFFNSFNETPAFRRGVGTGPFLRLVLAEAARYGMPMQAVCLIDDIAAILGFYEPVTAGQSSAIQGPLIQWRTDRRQPIMERVSDVEALAFKQRCLLAFGHAPEGHLVGTAEILVALGNTIKDLTPNDYLEIGQWASVDVHTRLDKDLSADELRKEKGWKLVTDDDVLKPGGRLHQTYLEIASHIRREVIASMKDDPLSIRNTLKPFARKLYLERNAVIGAVEKDAVQNGIDPDLATSQIHRSIEYLQRMYPDIAENPSNDEGSEGA